MTVVTVTQEIKAVFDQLKEVTELYDKDGNFLGLFTPYQLAQNEMVERAGEEFDLEQAERQLATRQKCFTTEQVLEHLKSLEKSK